MSDVAALEAEVKEFKLQLETVQSSLQVDPDNTELQSLKAELEELITLTETSIAELKPPPSPAAASRPSPPATNEKWSKETHPAYHAGHRKPGVEHQPSSAEEVSSAPPASFAVNENVLARWVSGDNAFYPARITSITGSSSNPVYVVSFKSYSTVETLTAKDIRPISGNDSRKRKADGTPGSSSSASQSPAPHPASSSVISAAADINPALANEARKEPSKATDGPTRPAKVPRKVKANRELEAGKMKWKDFASKGKLGRKDSMFRTGEGLTARVGFTGSGQQMRKDPTRTRHVYQQGEEEGY
ncbi:hypothetical protein ASPZODRAFT_135365 [Penicilliopsis zonata CBS 506.65]|uniref:Tudor domain-containing protein n=1 Tax=Penicilliopsis zonata CBS 506.65 TaxID=1073090 RepID=A0A1L9SA19_9EURO|nr:hypothetical protein ASPZODRAFT_135365 [Penicilliopsis zonata CBS 506.65]OJJ43957.1 hypothetical protein ASPZODRAFT_135365 [Penicilliopsis zonata CBS 506.65]